MIVDSSAVLAILFAEDDAPDYARAIEAAETCRISAANWLETAIRIDRGGDPIASNAFDDFVREAGVIVEARAPAAGHEGAGEEAGREEEDHLLHEPPRWSASAPFQAGPKPPRCNR